MLSNVNRSSEWDTYLSTHCIYDGSFVLMPNNSLCSDTSIISIKSIVQANWLLCNTRERLVREKTLEASHFPTIYIGETLCDKISISEFTILIKWKNQDDLLHPARFWSVDTLHFKNVRLHNCFKILVVTILVCVIYIIGQNVSSSSFAFKDTSRKKKCFSFISKMCICGLFWAETSLTHSGYIWDYIKSCKKGE